MFSLAVVDTDIFTEMPCSTQALYFHLGLHGDDDGFVASPRKIARAVGANDDDLRLLAGKGFVIPFDNGVLVIRDWNINNTLKNDRYHETIYREERSMLVKDATGRYQLASNLEPSWNQVGTDAEPERNLTKSNITEERRKADKPPRASRFFPPSVDEVRAYCEENGYNVDAARFVDFYTANGWVQGKGKPIKDWKAAVRTWERRDAKGGKGQGEGDNYADLR